jgi:hypothetical protein
VPLFVAQTLEEWGPLQRTGAPRPAPGQASSPRGSLTSGASGASGASGGRAVAEAVAPQ